MPILCRSFALFLSLAVGSLAMAQPHPDFALPGLDGEVIRLSDHDGKKVLLFHFASW